MEFFKFLVHITAFDYSFIQCGSNSLHLLIQMKVDLKNIDFENNRIKNTSLIGANFVNCNFNGSLFENVDICGINLNGAQLFNYGHSNPVKSVCFSLDGTILASGSSDITLRLWNANTGQQKSILDGHSNYVRSVCFSPDGTALASGSNDKSIRLWDVKTRQQKSKLDGHSHYFMSVCFSPDGNTLTSGSYDTSIRLWMLKQETKLNLQIKVIKIFWHNLKLHYFKTILIHSFYQYYYSTYIPISNILRIRSFNSQRRICKSIRLIQKHYLNRKEVVFWKTKLKQKKSDFCLFLNNITNTYSSFASFFTMILRSLCQTLQSHQVELNQLTFKQWLFNYFCSQKCENYTKMQYKNDNDLQLHHNKSKDIFKIKICKNTIKEKVYQIQ